MSTGAQTPFWLQISAIVLAPILGFVGVAVGAVIKDRSDRKNALRQERRKVYTSYLSHVSSSVGRFVTVESAKLRTGDGRKIREVFDGYRHAFNELEVAFLEVDLLGSKDTRDAAGEAFKLVLSQGHIISRATQGEIDQLLLSRLNSERASALMAFRRAAAKDLGIPRRERRRPKSKDLTDQDLERHVDMAHEFLGIKNDGSREVNLNKEKTDL